MVTLTLAPEYGLVVITAISSYFVSLYMGGKVGAARKTHNVPYPTMYTGTNVVFDCIQRGHQNYLENHPSFLALLLLGGVRHPLIATVSGCVWLVGRLLYFSGYATGDPKKRYRGGVQYLGLLGLVGTSVSLSVALLSQLA